MKQNIDKYVEPETPRILSRQANLSNGATRLLFDMLSAAWAKDLFDLIAASEYLSNIQRPKMPVGADVELWASQPAPPFNFDAKFEECVRKSLNTLVPQGAIQPSTYVLEIIHTFNIK